jgi:hypothetical protein
VNRATVVILLAAFASTGCGGKAEEPPSTIWPKEQLPEAIAKVICRGVGSCCSSLGSAFDVALCESVLQARYAAQSICASSRAYQPEFGSACVTGIADAFAQCPNGVGMLGGGYCSSMCRGTSPVGATCTSFQDCAQSSTQRVSCSALGPNDNRVCFVQTRGRLGDTCVETCSEFEIKGKQGWSCSFPSLLAVAATSKAVSCYVTDGLYCSSQGICESRLPVGASCAPMHDVCTLGAVCAGDPPLCIVPAPIGGTCLSQASCAFLAYCTPEKVCVAKKALGVACVENGECASAQCDATTRVCVTNTSPVLGGIVINSAVCADPTAIPTLTF